jgi:hypothetical protein
MSLAGDGNHKAMRQDGSTKVDLGSLGPAAPVAINYHPRGKRVETNVPAIASLCRQRELEVIVTNVSVGGFSADAVEDLPIGAQMILQVADLGDLPAVVRWSLSGRFGARFNGRFARPDKELFAGLVRMRLSALGGERLSSAWGDMRAAKLKAHTPEDDLSHLLRQAKRCGDLAATTSDANVYRTLLEMANHYDEQAKKLGARTPPAERLASIEHDTWPSSRHR